MNNREKCKKMLIKRSFETCCILTIGRMNSKIVLLPTKYYKLRNVNWVIQIKVHNCQPIMANVMKMADAKPRVYSPSQDHDSRAAEGRWYFHQYKTHACSDGLIGAGFFICIRIVEFCAYKHTERNMSLCSVRKPYVLSKKS